MLSSKRLMARIYMPKIGIDDIERLKQDKPFLLRAEVPVGAQFVSVCSIPSVIDMVGFSGGGGPPAFAYLVNPDEKKLQLRLLLTQMPENPFDALPEGLDVVSRALGIIQVMGMLLMGFEYVGVGVARVQEHFEASGANVFGTQPYVIPDVMKMMMLQKLQQTQAMSAQGKSR